MIRFGRRVLLTTLDEIPPRFRTSIGILVANQTELDAVENGDPETTDRLARIAYSASIREALLTERKPAKRTKKLAPSTRLGMLHAARLTERRV